MNNRKVKKVKVPSSPEDAYKKALGTALNIVAYKDNTEMQLREKLLGRGYESYTVDAVLQYMTDKGFVNEERMMINAALRMARVKLYGKARIKKELALKGFGRETLSLLDWECDDLCELDFSDICLKLLQKRGGERCDKNYAFLLRYGHSSSDIRTAFARIQESTGDETD